MAFFGWKLTPWWPPIQEDSWKHNWGDLLKKVTFLLLPDLGLVIIWQEGPSVFDRKRAAVGHINVANNFRLIQDAPKIQIHSFEGEVWETHLSPEFDMVHMRMLKVTDS